MNYSATITRVIDGDTVVARLDLGLGIECVKHVRLFGINAPELNHQTGQITKEWLKDRILFHVINLEVDQKKTYDKYGRLLAVLWLDGGSINQELIDKGYAVVYESR